MGHGIVLNRIVLYYGSGKVLRCTIGYTDWLYHQYSANKTVSQSGKLVEVLASYF